MKLKKEANQKMSRVLETVKEQLWKQSGVCGVPA